MATSTALHSNAFNFMSFINGGVDPRTGLYTLSVALPELKTDDLAGPVLPLALVFSPLNTRDTGYGLGWNLQLTQYSPDSRILSLSTGETFKVTETAPDGRMLMKEQKLDSFHAHDLGNDRYRIVHKSGLVETLALQGAVEQAVALPVEVHSADGRLLQHPGIGNALRKIDILNPKRDVPDQGVNGLQGSRSDVAESRSGSCRYLDHSIESGYCSRRKASIQTGSGG